MLEREERKWCNAKRESKRERTKEREREREESEKQIACPRDKWEWKGNIGSRKGALIKDMTETKQ